MAILDFAATELGDVLLFKLWFDTFACCFRQRKIPLWWWVVRCHANSVPSLSIAIVNRCRDFKVAMILDCKKPLWPWSIWQDWDRVHNNDIVKESTNTACSMYFALTCLHTVIEDTSFVWSQDRLILQFIELCLAQQRHVFRRFFYDQA